MFQIIARQFCVRVVVCSIAALLPATVNAAVLLGQISGTVYFGTQPTFTQTTPFALSVYLNMNDVDSFGRVTLTNQITTQTIIRDTNPTTWDAFVADLTNGTNDWLYMMQDGREGRLDLGMPEGPTDIGYYHTHSWNLGGPDLKGATIDYMRVTGVASGGDFRSSSMQTWEFWGEPVPEPPSRALLSLVAAGLAFLRRPRANR